MWVTGDAEACRKIKYTEAGGFSGGVAGGELVADKIFESSR